MKVSKITFKEEVMDIEPQPIIKFAKFAPLDAWKAYKEGEEITNHSIDMTEIVFQWKTVKNTNGERKDFLVEMKSLLETFVFLGNEEIESLKRRSFEHGHLVGLSKGKKEGAENKRLTIKTLPWYKRLFNKF